MTFLRQVGVVATAATALLVWQGAGHSTWAGSAKRPPNPLCDRAAFRVAVDVGHTAQSPGAMSARGVGEYDFNLRLARRIEQDLVHAGFGRTVLLVTDGPTRKGLAERVARANALSPDLFLSIHHDLVPELVSAALAIRGHRTTISVIASKVIPSSSPTTMPTSTAASCSAS